MKLLVIIPVLIFVKSLFAEECDEIHNTVRSGIKILNNVSESSTIKTINNLNNDLKDAKESLEKFSSSVTFAVKNFISTNSIDDNEESELPNLENYVVIFKDKVADVQNFVEDILNSSKINDDYINVHNKHIDTIKDKITSETKMFEEFLNQTNVPRDCAIFKFQNKITNLLTRFEQNVPSFHENIAKALKDKLNGWKNVLEGRNSTIAASFKGCLVSENVQCCVNDFIASQGFLILKEVNLVEKLSEVSANIFQMFSVKNKNVVTMLNIRFKMLYDDLKLC